jgi:hypothetical protein
MGRCCMTYRYAKLGNLCSCEVHNCLAKEDDVYQEAMNSSLSLNMLG